MLCIEELKKNEIQSDLGVTLIWEARDSLSKKVPLMLISEYSRSSHTHRHTQTHTHTHTQTHTQTHTHTDSNSKKMETPFQAVNQLTQRSKWEQAWLVRCRYKRAMWPRCSSYWERGRREHGSVSYKGRG